MKKIISFLILALLISGSVFAQTGEETTVPGSTNETDNLTVTLSITSKDDVEWFKGETGPTLDSWESNRADTEPLNESLKVYPAVKTNRARPISLTVTGGPLKSASTPSAVVKLQATPGGEGATPVIWDGGDDDASIVFTEPERDSYSKRVYYGELTLSLTNEGYGNAPALNDYSATLTLAVTPGQE